MRERIVFLKMVLKQGNIYMQKWNLGTFLVIQWLRLRQPMEETQVSSLIQEDPTCRRAGKPVHHIYGACTLEPMRHNNGAREL